MDKPGVPLQGAYTTAVVRELIGGWRLTHQTVALVPTMGSLHRGHLSLMQVAREHADRVVCSIFVNPIQFGPGEDFAAYPRSLADDEMLLQEQGLADLVFAPDEGDIYPFGIDAAVKVSVPQLSTELCAASRPGHFDGVASVVLRLLGIVTPDVMALGEKDYQQLVMLRRMVRDLQLPVKVVGGSIQRERDGLAMSTRNRYLSPAERKVAPRLHVELKRLRKSLRNGGKRFARPGDKSGASAGERGFRSGLCRGAPGRGPHSAEWTGPVERWLYRCRRGVAGQRAVDRQSQDLRDALKRLKARIHAAPTPTPRARVPFLRNDFPAPSARRRRRALSARFPGRQPGSSATFRSRPGAVRFPRVPASHSASLQRNSVTSSASSSPWRGVKSASALGVANLFHGHTIWQSSQPKIRLPMAARYSTGMLPRNSIVR